MGDRFGETQSESFELNDEGVADLMKQNLRVLSEMTGG